ncbi:MAG: shikimate dehydrogenase [Blautia sp.]|nr:shikimate dehydrogenase [Lachnoclostridium sp.]MCM1210509.1 shikimate dehydrogenase [Blautia sp.]
MDGINGKTRTCGLIGNPVEHTLSPVIHNTLAQRCGHHLVYVPFLVDKGRLEDALKGAYALNILGMNVTVPYKTEVMQYLEEVDSLAAKIGAVNTLVRTEKGYKGYNTDMTGLYRAMVSEGIRIEGEEIILLGAGGAARAVAYLCGEKGAARVYLLNRTLEKAKQVANEVNTAFSRELIVPMLLSDYPKLPDGKFLAIQGTSVGLAPHDGEAVIEDIAFYQKLHTGFDLIYKPYTTRFMQLAKEAGAAAYNGLKMLLYQGVIAYELWNQVEIGEEEAEFVYEKMRREMGL